METVSLPDGRVRGGIGFALVSYGDGRTVPVSIRSILSTTIGVACVVAAVHCFGPLATAEGALCGGMAGSMFGLAAGTLKHGVVIGDRFSDEPKYGALFGAIVGSWALQFVTGLLELALIALAAITVIIAAVMATVRRN